MKNLFKITLAESLVNEHSEIKIENFVNNLLFLNSSENKVEEKERSVDNGLNFTANYGIISSRGNKIAFGNDSSYHLLSSLSDRILMIQSQIQECLHSNKVVLELVIL